MFKGTASKIFKLLKVFFLLIFNEYGQIEKELVNDNTGEEDIYNKFRSMRNSVSLFNIESMKKDYVLPFPSDQDVMMNSPKNHLDNSTKKMSNYQKIYSGCIEEKGKIKSIINQNQINKKRLSLS